MVKLTNPVNGKGTLTKFKKQQRKFQGIKLIYLSQPQNSFIAAVLERRNYASG